MTSTSDSALPPMTAAQLRDYDEATSRAMDKYPPLPADAPKAERLARAREISAYRDALMSGWTDEEHQRRIEAIRNGSTGATSGTDGGHPDDTERILCELAGLTLIEYDRRRDGAAKLLGLRVSTLDDEVAPRRSRPQEGESTGTRLLLADPEPWSDPVDGAALLDAIRATYCRYLILPEHADIALALWTLFAWGFDTFVVAPILAVTSPEKRCGKTTLLHLLHGLTRRALFASSITAAALFRTVERHQPTLIVDEADTFLRNSDELRGVLNAGHARASAVVIRTVGDDHEPRIFSVWCPKAIAMIGRLPDTLEDRAIGVPMKRRAPGEKVARLRLDRLTELGSLGRQAARWIADHATELHDADPEVPGVLHDRAADNWRALLAIADCAGETWAKAARVAACALSGATDQTSAGAGTALLSDARDIFAPGVDHLTTGAFLAELHKREEAPWPTWNKGKPIDARQVAKLLKPFSIRSGQVHPENVKGYERSAFADAFTRYLPPHPNGPNTPRENNNLDPLTYPNAPGSRSDSISHVTSRASEGCSARSDKAGVRGRYPSEVDDAEVIA